MEVSPVIYNQLMHNDRCSRHKSEHFFDKRKKNPLYKENSELWKTYRRLSSQQIESIANKKFNCNVGGIISVPATVDYPDRDGMKCMCYENLMRIIKESAFIPAPVMYRIPSRKPPKVSLDSVRPSWMKKAMADYRNNQQLQYPMATITVRWQQKRSLHNYDTKTLKSIFKKFGEVVDIRMLTANSCIVIFGEIKAACQAVESKILGDSLNNLHCAWWHRSMANKSVVARAKGVALKTDVFLL